MSKLSIWKRISKSIGPGVVTGVADDDPSGIATYAQTGAIFGLTQLWMTVYSLPLMIAVQEMCARIGMTTGKGIAGVIKSHYSKTLLMVAVVLLSIANIINIGADLGAMGQATSIISPLSFGVSLIAITIFTLICVIIIPYHLYARVLKYFAATVLSYIVAAFFIHQDWGAITFAAFIPHMEWNKEFLLNITAFLGTTISPYLFFWQADEEVEEEIETKKIIAFGKGRPTVSRGDIRQMRTDTITGMFLSNLIAFFIIITASGTLAIGGHHTITSATELAEALRPLAGDFAVYLFAFGILGTGLLAIPVLAGAVAYAVAETLGIPLGLSKTFKQAVGFYGVLIISILVGVLLNFIDIDPILMLYYAAAVNGILAAPLLVIILFVANNRAILGDKVNGKLSNTLVIITTVIMAIISLFTIESFFR
jgi:NRAMP (natural resistance-associated macrophage protein)-like metal ion transporter